MRRKSKREPIYEQLRNACKSKGTTLSRTLNECGWSDGNTGAWKVSSYPRLDIMMDISEHLNMSLDELCYGIDKARAVVIDDNEREWLSIIRRIPEDKQKMCRDFIETHAVEPEKTTEKRIS